MSYEYKLEFMNEAEAKNAYRKIGTAKWVSETSENRILLRGPRPGPWTYDVSVCWESEDSLLLVIAMPSSEVYAALLGAMAGLGYRCLEEGFDDDETTLAEAFRE